jgi:hypothetical protein
VLEAVPQASAEGGDDVTGLARALLEEIAVDPAALDRLRELVGDGAADPWLGTREAAAYAGCTVPALRSAMHNGEVEFEQRVPGGKTYFRRSALDRYRSGR